MARKVKNSSWICKRKNSVFVTISCSLRDAAQETHHSTLLSPHDTPGLTVESFLAGDVLLGQSNLIWNSELPPYVTLQQLSQHSLWVFNRSVISASPLVTVRSASFRILPTSCLHMSEIFGLIFCSILLNHKPSQNQKRQV